MRKERGYQRGEELAQGEKASLDRRTCVELLKASDAIATVLILTLNLMRARVAPLQEKYAEMWVRTSSLPLPYRR